MNMKKHLKSLGTSGLVLSSILLISQAQAATLNLDFSNVFEGTAPAGGLTASIEDTAANTVTVTLSVASPIVNEFVGQVYLNLDPALNPSLLTYGPVSASTGVELQNTIMGTNCCKADGAGKYDIFLDFKTGEANQFGNGESFVFTLTLNGLSSSSFAFQTTDGKDKGDFYGAAHIQNTGSDGTLSGWVGATDSSVPPVPVPGAAWLLGSGLIGLVGVARRKNA